MTLLLKPLFIPAIIAIAWIAIGIATHLIAARLKYVKLLSPKIFYYILFGPIGTIVISIHAYYLDISVDIINKTTDIKGKDYTKYKYAPKQEEVFVYHWILTSPPYLRYHSKRINKEGFATYGHAYNAGLAYIATNNLQQSDLSLSIEIELTTINIEDEIQREQSTLMLFI